MYSSEEEGRTDSNNPSIPLCELKVWRNQAGDLDHGG
jgi:hypothetical protein